MWPLDLIAKRKYNRRYNAALVVLLGTIEFENLSRERREQVEAEVDDNFNKTDTPAIAIRRLLTQHALAANRATAMNRLDFELGFGELSWPQLLKPWRAWQKVPEFTGRLYDSRADILLNDYRLFNQATHDAKELLKEYCINLPKKVG